MLQVFIEKSCLREPGNEVGQKWKRGYLKPAWGGRGRASRGGRILKRVLILFFFPHWKTVPNMVHLRVVYIVHLPL